jgi:hypothetical protein
MLTKQDRCDKCGAAALHQYQKSDLSLLFCNHHSTEFGDELKSQDFDLVHSEQLVDA